MTAPQVPPPGADEPAGADQGRARPGDVGLPTSGFGRRERLATALGFVALFLPTTAGVIALSLGGGPSGLLTRAVEQPISFDHAKHVKDLDLACSSCHLTVEKEAFSGLPSAEVCAFCHAEAQGKSAEEARLVKLIKAGTPLEWKPLFRQPAHVFYSHRRHVTVGRIECPVCHGSIAETKAPPGRVRKLQMDDCLACHRKKGVSTDCTGCHR